MKTSFFSRVPEFTGQFWCAGLSFIIAATMSLAAHGQTPPAIVFPAPQQSTSTSPGLQDSGSFSGRPLPPSTFQGSSQGAQSGSFSGGGSMPPAVQSPTGSGAFGSTPPRNVSPLPGLPANQSNSHLAPQQTETQSGTNQSSTQSSTSPQSTNLQSSDGQSDQMSRYRGRAPFVSEPVTGEAGSPDSSLPGSRPDLRSNANIQSGTNPLQRQRSQSNLDPLPQGSVPPSSTGGGFNSLQPGTNSPGSTVSAGAPNSNTSPRNFGVQTRPAGSRGSFTRQESGSTSNDPSTNECKIAECRVELIADIEVPARSTGPLAVLSVDVNQIVTQDELVAQIDDREAQKQLELAKLKYEMARTQAQDETSIQMAENKVKLAHTEYTVNYNLFRKRSKTKQEALRAQYSYRISQLEEVQARNEVDIARMNASGELVGYRASEDAVERHQIKSPVNGVVLEKFRDAGEWVNRGDKVVRIARLDKLHVRGVVSAGSYEPWIFDNKRVLITTTLGNREIQFEGRVARTDLIQQGVNEFGVIVEVNNQRENDHWLLLPGSFVKGKILLNENAPASSASGQDPNFSR